MEKMKFQAESKELLNLMINSIYSNKEIFLREIISNASDAIDKYHYNVLTSNGELKDRNYEILINVDKNNRVLSITDNGIGLTKEELVENLGVIAKSGSKEFINKLKEIKDDSKVDIIGQFGVGFYSVFMVAKNIQVITKSYKDKTGYIFESEGKDTFSIDEYPNANDGTTINIFLKDDTKDENYSKYLDQYEIQDLVKKYSDYVRYPIKMNFTISKQDLDDKGEPIENKYHDEQELRTLNSMIPLWKKNKKDVSEKELNEFYKSKYYDSEDPLLSIYVNVEGMISYNALIFIPAHAPYDLYSDNYEKGLNLYVKGIFIKDRVKELIPDYLKFARGLVDSNDLNLNISREMLQESVQLRRIRDNIESKIVSELKKLKENDFDKYVKFFELYGTFVKYGIYTSYGSKSELLKDLLIYKSLKHEDKPISLKQYVSEMNKEQKFIYFASGSSYESIKLMPQIDLFKKKDIDVLLFKEPVDEFSILSLREYDKKEFKSISNEDVDVLSEEEKENIKNLNIENKELLDKIKDCLKDKVDDVVLSSKLTNAPVCLSNKDGLTLEMEETLNKMQGNENQEAYKASKVLEINPNHDLFKGIKSLKDSDELEDYANLLYDQAMLIQGFSIKDPEAFINLLTKIMVKSIK